MRSGPAHATHYVAPFALRNTSEARLSRSISGHGSSFAMERGAELSGRSGVNSVEVAGLILQSLADAPGSARLADLARATGMPSGKVHRYLVSLIRSGLVEQDPGTSRYDLGPLVLRAGVVALSRSDALKRAERMLEAIVARTGETAAAAVWGSHGPTLVRLVEARHELATQVPPDMSAPSRFPPSATFTALSAIRSGSRRSPRVKWHRAARPAGPGCPLIRLS